MTDCNTHPHGVGGAPPFMQGDGCGRIATAVEYGLVGTGGGDVVFVDTDRIIFEGGIGYCWRFFSPFCGACQMWEC